MRRLSILFVGLVLLAAVGCVIEPDFDPEKAGTFPCDTDEDCTAPRQTCVENGNGTKVCAVEITECNDVDGDGFGTGDVRSTCDACISQGNCQEDCDDNDPAVHPGQVDRCDGEDNNCDGVVDKPGSVGCRNDNRCPLTDGDLPQTKTAWICSDVDGQ